MDFNEYFAEQLVRERVAEARAFRARSVLVDSLRPPRRPVRLVLGLALIRAGRWILGRAPESAGDLTGFRDTEVMEPVSHGR